MLENEPKSRGLTNFIIVLFDNNKNDVPRSDFGNIEQALRRRRASRGKGGGAKQLQTDGSLVKYRLFVRQGWQILSDDSSEGTLKIQVLGYSYIEILTDCMPSRNFKENEIYKKKTH